MEFLRLADGVIPNLAGIKYTASTLQEYQACLQYKKGRFDILYGVDELLLPALAVGARGAIGSTYTFAAPLYLATMEAFRNGDLEAARQSHGYMVEVIRTLLKYPPIPGQKAMMKMLGWDLGPCRLPLATLDEETYAAFYEELARLSFFEKLGVKSTAAWR
jgi:N-acetylneuraminate lyase